MVEYDDKSFEELRLEDNLASNVFLRQALRTPSFSQENNPVFGKNPFGSTDAFRYGQLGHSGHPFVMIVAPCIGLHCSSCSKKLQVEASYPHCFGSDFNQLRQTSLFGANTAQAGHNVSWLSSTGAGTPVFSSTSDNLLNKSAKNKELSFESLSKENDNLLNKSAKNKELSFESLAKEGNRKQQETSKPTFTFGEKGDSVLVFSGDRRARRAKENNLKQQESTNPLFKSSTGLISSANKLPTFKFNFSPPIFATSTPSVGEETKAHCEVKSEDKSDAEGKPADKTSEIIVID